MIIKAWNDRLNKIIRSHDKNIYWNSCIKEIIVNAICFCGRSQYIEGADQMVAKSKG